MYIYTHTHIHTHTHTHTHTHYTPYSVPAQQVRSLNNQRDVRTHISPSPLPPLSPSHHQTQPPNPQPPMNGTDLGEHCFARMCSAPLHSPQKCATAATSWKQKFSKQSEIDIFKAVYLKHQLTREGGNSRNCHRTATHIVSSLRNVQCCVAVWCSVEQCGAV